MKGKKKKNSGCSRILDTSKKDIINIKPTTPSRAISFIVL
jgi:hypothetical protein